MRKQPHLHTEDMTPAATVSNVCTNSDPSVEQPATMSISLALVCSPNNVKQRYKEHTRYIKNNNPQSAYALHILNHEYSPIEKTMTQKPLPINPI